MKNLTLIALLFLASFSSFAQSYAKPRICQKCGGTHILNEGSGTGRQMPHLYPTLAKEEVTVEIDKQDNPCQYNFVGSVIGYSIINEKGDTVAEFKVEPTDKLDINTDRFEKGTYYILLKYDTKIEDTELSLEKFIKE